MTAALCCTALVLGGCSRQPPDAVFRSAEEKFASGKYKESAEDLRRVLRTQPDHVPAGQRLAESLIGMGDFAAAEAQLRRMPRESFPDEFRLPLLATSMLAQENYTGLVAEFETVKPGTPEAQVSVLCALGEARIALRQLEKAQQAFSAALDIRPGDPRARTGQARLAAIHGDRRTAEKVTDEVLTRSPGATQAMALKADLLRARGDHAGAISVQSALVAMRPNDARARYALVSLLVASNDLERLPAQIDALKALRPQDAQWRYYEAVLAMRRDETQKAGDAVRAVLTAMPEHGPSLLLSAAMALKRQALPEAERQLRKVLALYPENPTARSMLAGVYLRSGKPEEAQKVLAPALESAPGDPTVLRAAGELAFARNALGEAIGYYEQALAAEKDNVASRTRLGQLRLTLGQTGQALEELEAASALDPARFQADLSLVSAYLGRNELDKALAAATVLRNKQPASARAYAVLGTVYMARKDAGNARTNFEKALSIEFNDLPSAQSLASLDLAQGRPESARKRFEAILDKEPANEGALLSLAQTLISSSAPAAEVRAIIERAVKANPASVSSRIALIHFLARSGDPGAALSVAQLANSTMPQENRILEALGLAALAAGQTQRAIDAFGRLAKRVPQSPAPLTRLAAAQFAAGQSDDAIKSLRAAIAIDPQLAEAHYQIVRILSASGRTNQALSEARAYQSARPRDALGYVLEGNVLAGLKQPAAAADAYAKAIARQAPAEVLVKLHQQLTEAGKPAQAAQAAQKWLAGNAQDHIVRYYLADRAARAKQHQEAALRYREILALRPDDPLALNNLAWALNDLGDPQALQTAERAHRLAPNDPQIQDTYGWLLLAAGDTKRSLDLLQRAAGALPDVPEVRLHLGKALLKSGDPKGARREFESAARLGDNTPLEAEAERLLRSL